MKQVLREGVLHEGVLHEGVLHERKDPFVRYLFCFLETAFYLIRPETAIKLVSEY